MNINSKLRILYKIATNNPGDEIKYVHKSVASIPKIYNNHVETITVRVAKVEPNDTYPVEYKIIRNTTRHAIAGIGVKIRTTPNEVAIAFPPLKFRNIEKQ